MQDFNKYVKTLLEQARVPYTVGVYADIFNPPHSMHYRVAKRMLEENDTALIIICKDVGYSDDIWRVYNKKLQQLTGKQLQMKRTSMDPKEALEGVVRTLKLGKSVDQQIDAYSDIELRLYTTKQSQESLSRLIGQRGEKLVNTTVIGAVPDTSGADQIISAGLKTRDKATVTDNMGETDLTSPDKLTQTEKDRIWGAMTGSM